MWIWRRMEKISWVDKVTEEVLSRAHEGRQILNYIWQRKHWWISHVLRHDKLLHGITEGRMRGKLIRGRRRIQMPHTIWQMMMTMLHSNGQIRTERDGDTRKDVKNLLCSRRLMTTTLMMMMMMMMSFQLYALPILTLPYSYNNFHLL